MILVFELSMPNCGSWNGQWSGGSRYYAKVVNMGRSKKGYARAREILEKGYFRYSFGDGWTAGISVKEVTGKEAAKARRKTDGFCGYDWMVDSIRQDLAIIAPSQRKVGANG